MKHSYNYLIVGGGMTADAAASGIREIDTRASIGLIGSDPDGAYDRPPLSKGLWKDQSADSILRSTADRAVTLHLGRKATAIDPAGKRVIDDEGNEYAYDKLLLATGGRPRRLAVAEESRVIYYRTLADYRRLRKLTGGDRRFAVIGGGFIGSEIAAALAMNGRKVALIFPGAGIGDRMFPASLSEFITDHYRKKGVEVHARSRVSGIDARNGELVIRTADGREIVADEVVAGLGIEPNVELARAAGLKVQDGIEVDEHLRTSEPAIYAAGDVASFHNPALGKRLRVEHEDNANTMGRCAGHNMAGQAEPYHHLPFFYSDLFEFGYEAVGETDSRLETVNDWSRPNEEGVIYYLRDNRVRGVLLWSIFGQVDAARSLIAEPGPHTAEKLRGRLPEKSSG